MATALGGAKRPVAASPLALETTVSTVLSLTGLRAVLTVAMMGGSDLVASNEASL